MATSRPPTLHAEGRSQRLSLTHQLEIVLEECRIVLPGIQALFGFQLAVVFSERFARILTHPQQVLHLLAMALVAVAIALIMAPAAYHRQCERRHASVHFVRLSTHLLLASMPPLALAICLEFYLVAQVMLSAAAAWIAAALLGVFVLLWLVLPRVARRRRRDG